jgi:hypothetical protein
MTNAIEPGGSTHRARQPPPYSPIAAASSWAEDYPRWQVHCPLCGYPHVHIDGRQFEARGSSEGARSVHVSARHSRRLGGDPDVG